MSRAKRILLMALKDTSSVPCTSNLEQENLPEVTQHYVSLTDIHINTMPIFFMDDCDLNVESSINVASSTDYPIYRDFK